MNSNKDQQKRFPYFFVIAILFFIILAMSISLQFYALYKGQQSCVQSVFSKQQILIGSSVGNSCPVDITEKPENIKGKTS